MSEVSNVIDIRGIMKMLPHRYPFLLVDRVLEIEEGKRIKAIKNVTANEQFFVGHFEQYPVMPGAKVSDVVASFGPIKPDTLPLTDIAANRKAASELVDKVGLNEGPTQ